MTPNRPYLLRGLNEWILDNGMTPHILVDAGVAGTQVPETQVKDGRIVLNIAPAAVRDLIIDNQTLAFHARFGGRPFEVRVPVGAVLAIYARETGRGMVFRREEAGPAEGAAKTPSRPSLKVIK
jgi:stringent starvation protein B